MKEPITDDDIAGARTLVPAECVGLLRIVDGMREMIYTYRRILAAAPDILPLARVAELHEDAITMGGCAEVNECDLAALTAEVLQARAKLAAIELFAADLRKPGISASYHGLGPFIAQEIENRLKAATEGKP